MTWSVFEQFLHITEKYNIAKEDVAQMRIALENVRPGSLLTPTCAIVDKLNHQDWRYLAGDEAYIPIKPLPQQLSAVAFSYYQLNVDYCVEQFRHAFYEVDRRYRTISDAAYEQILDEYDERKVYEDDE